ncbi:MAG: hypothetical protein M1840_004107 [Geoglossum simile]|nr:MAG: hypothetical protein M1840_004107 [Geoglossum simile]
MARPVEHPTILPPIPTRSPSLSSTVIARSDSSISISSTPATSNADASSVLALMNNEDLFRAAAEAGACAARDGDGTSRVKRVRKSLLASYNENILSGTAKRKSMEKASGRTASGETLIADGQMVGVESGVFGESIKVSDMEWRAGRKESSSPIHKGQLAETEGAAGGVGVAKRRRSTRLGLFIKAKGFYSDVKSGTNSAVCVLGKRTRGVVEIGSQSAKNTLEGLRGKRGGSLRLQAMEQQNAEQSGEPTKKKARFSEASTVDGGLAPAEMDQVLPPRPRGKLWLSSGLYVGQDPEFKPHLTERKNKALAASRRKSGERRPFLPLPMFAGKRLLENDRNFKLPFDIFSPLPARQPKPAEWRKVSQNIFVGEAAEIWKKNKIKEVSKCVCTPENGCDEDCQNRHMFYECDENNCAVGPERCSNRSFADLKERCKAGGKYHIGVEVFKTEDRGYGVRANRSFEPNQIILEYAGEIITQEECERRMKKEYKKKECFYLMVFDQNMIIDATRGSIARFVNHSCEPNCKMVKWTVSGKPRMALFAGENGVMTGEELCYDYNFDPFSIKNVQECRCASANCRGVLGPKQPPTKEQKKEVIKPLVKHAKRKLKQYLSDGKDDSSTSKGLEKRRPAATTAKKGFLTAPLKTTPKTTARGSMRRRASSSLPSRPERQITHKSPKGTLTLSPAAGTRSARLQKSTLRRVVNAVKRRTPAANDTLSIRSSPRKKVKTFKAIEAAEVVMVARKQSGFKIAASRAKKGVVRNAKGSKARVMGRGRERKGRRVS